MRVSRVTGTFSGALIMLLGLWGALVPFIGPYFDYSFGVNSTWHYTADRLWLCIIPGAVAVVAGLMLLTAGSRPTGVFAGWLAVAAGAWFVVGPAVSLTWETGPGPIGAPLYGPTRQMLELVGYFYGLGALIVALGAYAIGCFAARPGLVEEPAVGRRRRRREAAAMEPVTAPAAAAPAAAAPAVAPPAAGAPVATAPANTPVERAAPATAPVATQPGASGVAAPATAAPPPQGEGQVAQPGVAPAAQTTAVASPRAPERTRPRFPLIRRRRGLRRSSEEEQVQR
jgi:hypothetical protein